jgi:ATP-dependent RNA helicase RhlE
MSTEQLGHVSERPISRVQAVPSTESRPAADQPAATTPLTFDQLGLTPELLRAVADQGYTEPTPVQAQSIPIVLAGRDLLAGAQTGTGKTAAFVLPILQLLNASTPAVKYIPAGKARRRGETGLPIRCLVLTPTRELALQIEECVRTYGAQRPIMSTTIYGGVGFQPQVRALKNGPEIVVATPGRLLDHAGQGTIDLSSVEILVLDEADRMLDMGFIRDIRRIMELLPATRQNLLFSATFSNDIRDLASGILNEPAFVQISRPNAPIELVRQVVYPVDRERKRELLSHLIKEGRIDRALVFTRTKHGANRLAEQLCDDGIAATAIHGNKSQGQRVRALDDFKAGRASILVATEVASRGIDIDGLPHVVNFELPMVAQDYVHRIGRTGRAGLEGDAVSLVCIDENMLMGEIESMLRTRITREVVPGFEVNHSIPREPILQRSGGGVRRPSDGRRAPSRQPSRAATPFRGPAPAPYRGEAPSRAAAPFRGATSAPFRQPAAAPFRAEAQARGAAPNGMRQFPNAAPRPTSGTGFNTSRPVEPRRSAAPGGFRRPTASDFSQAPSVGIGAGRNPQGPRNASPRNDGRSRPTQRPAAGRPSDGGYRQAARPGFGPRPAPRDGFSSIPGERIARQENRPR